jgi:hypothetical protein
MTDTVAQLIAGVILIGIAGVAAFIGYRVGLRRGVSQALLLDDANQRGREREEFGQRHDPPSPPPTVVH